MIQKKTFNSAVKNHDFDLLVGFERRHDLAHLQNGFGAEDLSGGWSNVTRQYVAERSVNRTCVVSCC